ncbi:hypothetical protein ABZV67_45510 [Streptomyces sp. NPDC005065]|uniref:hypothetical protein n=1 Tax=Streptomyces sp. NPDC005065 TaxID=3154461 RepID=UPI00339ED01C
MRIIIEDVSEELTREIAALIGRRQDSTKVSIDAEWSVARAELLLRDLPAVAGQLIREAVHGDGWAPAERLRGVDGTASLRGRSGAITKAITRGAVAQHWPSGMPQPLHAQYDPDRPSTQRTIGYRMAAELVPTFRAAVMRVDGDGSRPTDKPVS